MVAVFLKYRQNLCSHQRRPVPLPRCLRLLLQVHEQQQLLPNANDVDDLESAVGRELRSKLELCEDRQRTNDAALSFVNLKAMTKGQ